MIERVEVLKKLTFSALGYPELRARKRHAKHRGAEEYLQGEERDPRTCGPPYEKVTNPHPHPHNANAPTNQKATVICPRAAINVARRAVSAKPTM